MRKMKYLTDQVQLCFRFCVGNTKQLCLFLLWQQSWHPYRRQFAGCCNALSCLCIPVSNAIPNEYSVILLLC